jgi:hypothetical protein
MTDHGDEVVPTDLVSVPEGWPGDGIEVSEGGHDEWDAVASDLADFLEGHVQTLQIRTGYLARMSAPGFMDCTPWTIHTTEREARDALEELYGD